MKGKMANNRQTMSLHPAKKLLARHARHAKAARKIVVGEKLYYWLYKKSKVIIWPDAGGKYVYSVSKVVGMTPDDVDRGTQKGWFKFVPRDVAQWIKEQKI